MEKTISASGGRTLTRCCNAGLIGAKQVDVLDAALDAGSAATHRGNVPDAKEVDVVMDIIENLLQAVYVLPDIATRLKERTPQRPKRNTKK